MNRLPADFPAEAVVVGEDRREQHPWDFTKFGMRQEPVSYSTGDYGLVAIPNAIRLERKSRADYVACCGKERKRFQAELDRLIAFPARAVIVEAGWTDLEAGGWRSKISPQCVIGSTIGWLERGIPIVLAGNRSRAEQIAARMLVTCARRRWRELRLLATGMGESAS